MTERGAAVSLCTPPMQLIPLLLIGLVPSAGSSVQEKQPAGKPPASQHPAHALYLANCASCHGEKGDGKGTTVLDRPARSFLAGGFSYGNTHESILRSIRNGIPGTPMPSFESALNEEQRKSLADYVIQLGPEQVKVDPKDSLLRVGSAPLIVRGKLPPVVGGKGETVRGLLVGTADGLSYEYRVDDMRLLAVRAGEFVDRADWVGRGGDALRPLGKLVYLRPEDEAEFYARGLVIKLISTSTAGGEARLVYSLHASAAAPALLQIEETPRPWRTSVGSGFLRHFTLRPGSDKSEWKLEQPLVRWSAPKDGRADLMILRSGAAPLTLEEIRVPQLPWSEAAAERERMVAECLKGA